MKPIFQTHAAVAVEPWIDELLQLVARFAGLNIDADLGAMTRAELWALYLHLRRLTEV